VHGVLDLLCGPASNWMINGVQAAKVFQLAKTAMDQWAINVQRAQARFSEEQMKISNLDLYEDMGNPVLWAGVLCHKVIRECDVCERHYAGVRKDDWTMKAVHSHCKKHQHHRFWDVNRNGKKTPHTLRIRGVGKIAERKQKAEKISQLLAEAGGGHLTEDVMNMAVLEDVEKPPGSLTSACADELWRRWKEQRDSEHADRVEHMRRQKEADEQIKKEGIERVLRIRQQRADHAQEEDSDFSDEEDDYEDNADPSVSALYDSEEATIAAAGGSQSQAVPDEVVRAESDELMLNPPSAQPSTSEHEGEAMYEEEENDVVHINDGDIDPDQMERDFDRIQRKRKGIVNTNSPLSEGEFHMPSDDDYDFEEAEREDKRSCATLGGAW